MTLKAEETRVVSIGDRTIAVTELPERAQQLVAYYDDWKQRELDARSHLLSLQIAMQGITHQIAQAVEEDAAAKAEVEAPAANESGEGDA